MKIFGSLVVGAIGGIAFVVACTSGGTSAGSSAHASPGDCSSFQVANFQLPFENGGFVSPSVDKPFDLPPGWEPIAVGGTEIVARRCKP